MEAMLEDDDVTGEVVESPEYSCPRLNRIA